MAIDEIPLNTIEPPEWLDKTYIRTALREGYGAPDLEIISMIIKPATNVGDNYASQMFRATVSIKRSPKDELEQHSIVIKSLPKKGKATDMMSDWSVFKREAVMLSIILPKINELLLSFYPSMEPLSAKCIWFCEDPEEIIILEDLKELGYSNINRQAGVDYEHTNIVLESLAKFHAATYVLLKTEPEIFADYSESTWGEKYEKGMRSFFEPAIEAVMSDMKKWSDVPEDYVRKLLAVKDNLIQDVVESAQSDEKDLIVLQHGDCWTNNFMFRHRGGKPVGFRFVDFQICSKNSAAMDLNYFIFSSTKSEIRTAKIDEMLETYYKTFMATLNGLKIQLDKPFTFQDLKTEFMKRIKFGLLSLIAVFPITVLPPKNAIDINDFMDSNKNNQSFTSEAFKRGFLQALPYFIENGVI